jgi:hypothetical protein
MRIALAVASASLLAASTALAQPAPPWTIERKLVPGARLQVNESTRIEVRSMWRARAAAQGDASVDLFERRYVEEVRTAQPELVYRAVESSTRDKRRPQADANPERTSIHGRGVLVAGLDQRPDGAYEISKDDREAMRLDRLATALLPGRPVQRTDSWTIEGAALTRSLWGEYLVPAAGTQAKVDLKGVRHVASAGPCGDQDQATIHARVHMVVERTDQTPGVLLDLQGDLKWSIGDGALLDGHLEGTVSYTVLADDAGHRAELSAEGPLTWTWHGNVLAPRAPLTPDERATGAPPPPGTRVLICGQDPSHRYELEQFVRCPQCGAELDRSTRRCPNKHVWFLQYCPRDGAPLRPE